MHDPNIVISQFISLLGVLTLKIVHAIIPIHTIYTQKADFDTHEECFRIRQNGIRNISISNCGHPHPKNI